MPKKGYKSITIKENLYIDLNSIAEKLGTSIKQISEDALKEYIDKRRNQI